MFVATLIGSAGRGYPDLVRDYPSRTNYADIKKSLFLKHKL